ncbi:ATP-dependent Clp protease proteolytic subunit, partial [bacterium]|nr:ATP-dependent Clp protease proteolytic subunit [bacterium]
MSGSLCRRLFSIVVILSLGLGFFGSARSQEEPAPRLAEPGRYKVYRIELREAITSEHVSFFIHRAVVAAKAAKADAVILDINTPGGRLDLTTRIRDDLITLKMPSYAYVNNQAASAGALIAIAMDK